MTHGIDDILKGFSQLGGSESEKLDWLRARLLEFVEELGARIEGRQVEHPTYVGQQFNNALKEAAALVRGATKPDSG